MRLVLLLCLVCLSLPAACFAAPLKASVGKAGEVVLREGEELRTVATLRPGLFEAGWKSRGFTAGPQTGPPGTLSASLRTDSGATVTLTGQAVVEAGRLRVHYQMSTDKPVAVNSVHVSLSLATRDWASGEWELGGSKGTVPLRAVGMQLASGQVSRVAFTKGGRSMGVELGAPTAAMIQDNRYWGPGGDLEVRFGRLDGPGWTWQPQETLTMDLTLSPGGTVELAPEQPLVLQAGPNWTPLPVTMDIEKGSALDFSFLRDAPAGAHGWVVATPEGHFAFEKLPQKPVRFYGVNLCFSANYLELEEADVLAERLARLGYNTVRIHHYESGLVDDAAPDSLTLRKDSLDKLDYLFAALKKRGIYIKTDLFVSRPIRPSEAEGDFKMATLVSAKAMANWKAFSKELLEHVNPYTGLAYRSDPTLAWISLVNEPNATSYLDSLQGELLALFQARWSAWLRGRYASDATLAEAWRIPAATFDAPMPRGVDKDARGRDLAVFLATLHQAAYRDMSKFLRQEVGTKALLTYLNGWSEVPPFMAVRTEMDWVDNHFYWDHPRFLEGEWRLPSEGGSGGGSALEVPTMGGDSMAATRLEGKPFSVSEYNFAAPNRYRAESGLLLGAAAALQDWDALWRFAYSHARETAVKGGPLDYFDMATDPAQQASERAAILLFRRRDAAPAKAGVTSVATLKGLLEKPTAEGIPSATDLTLVTRIATRVGDTPSPGRAELTSGSSPEALAALRAKGLLAAANRTDLDQGVRQSDTGELLVEAASAKMAVNTPRTVGGAARAGDTLVAGPLTAKVAGARAVLYASSLDGKPLTKSGRILLAHITDVQSAGTKYAAADMRVLQEWGRGPHLVRTGTAEVTLTHDALKGLKAWRLDTSGHRVAPIPLQVRADKLVLRLSTRAGDGSGTLYYEIGSKGLRASRRVVRS
ncbi:MAG TPA: hypothetical protein VGN26_07300 [Armatimonadota bacterium]